MIILHFGIGWSKAVHAPKDIAATELVNPSTVICYTQETDNGMYEKIV